MPDDHHAQVALRHEHRGVRHRDRIDAVEEILHRPPGHLSRDAVPARDLRGDDRRGVVVERRITETVLTENLGRHSLKDLRVVGRPLQHSQLAVRVHVDEPRSQDQTACADLDRVVRQLEDTLVAVADHRHDARSLDGHIGEESVSPRAVDDGRAAIDPDRLLAAQKHVATAPMTRGSAASGSSMIATTRHLSKAVQGCDRPSRTTSPGATEAPGASARKAC